MNVVRGPDVFVNASVALGSAPEQVVQRLLADPEDKQVSVSKWVFVQVDALLKQVPSFKEDAIASHLGLIAGLVNVLPDEIKETDWKAALLKTAKLANTKRVITDHPDLADTAHEGVDFMSTDAWLLEQACPPPAP